MTQGVNVGSRTCPKCGLAKTAEGFYATCRTSYCRPCWNAYERARRKAKLVAETPAEREERLRCRRLKQYGRAERISKPVVWTADGMKVCNACGQAKRPSDFHRARRRKDGLASECKMCSLAKHKTYYEQNRERLIAYQVARRNVDPEAARIYEREVYRRRAAKAQASNRARARKMEPLDKDGVAYEQILRADSCSYCGGVAGQIDHIVPVVAGGRNHWPNLTAACQPCNRRKWSHSLLMALMSGGRSLSEEVGH